MKINHVLFGKLELLEAGKNLLLTCVWSGGGGLNLGGKLCQTSSCLRSQNETNQFIQGVIQVSEMSEFSKLHLDHFQKNHLISVIFLPSLEDI